MLEMVKHPWMSLRTLVKCNSVCLGNPTFYLSCVLLLMFFTSVHFYVLLLQMEVGRSTLQDTEDDVGLTGHCSLCWSLLLLVCVLMAAPCGRCCARRKLGHKRNFFCASPSSVQKSFSFNKGLTVCLFFPLLHTYKTLWCNQHHLGGQRSSHTKRPFIRTHAWWPPFVLVLAASRSIVTFMHTSSYSVYCILHLLLQPSTSSSRVGEVERKVRWLGCSAASAANRWRARKRALPASATEVSAPPRLHGELINRDAAVSRVCCRFTLVSCCSPSNGASEGQVCICRYKI